MPIYEFRCLSCGHIFEILKLKKKDEEIEMKCPKCKSPEIERILSKTNVVRSSSGKATHTVKSCTGGTCSTIEIPGYRK